MMKSKLKLVLFLATMCVLVLGTLIAYASLERKQSVQMTNVGGRTNQCDCSKRIER